MKYCRSSQGIINTAIQDLICGGGKHLRSILLIQSSKFGKIEKSRRTALASAVEMLHMATLVHDDIIDDAELRRGELTAQNKFNKGTAVFIGDYLLSRAYTLLAEKLSSHSLSRLNSTVRFICEGEIEQYQNRYDCNITIIDYLHRIRRKTALLFAVSCYLGAYESGVRGKMLNCFYKFGLEFGMSFQIKDDLLDFCGDEKKMGKKIGQDLYDGVYTLPLICIFKNNKYNKKAKKILEKNNLNNKDLNLLNIYIKESGSLDESRKMGKVFKERALKYLNFLNDIPARENMLYILEYQLKRDR